MTIRVRERLIIFALAGLLFILQATRATPILLANVAGVVALQAATQCGSEVRPIPSPQVGLLLYPPVECADNGQRLAISQELYGQARQMSPETAHYAERWIELTFARGKWGEAATAFDSLSTHQPTASPTLLPGDFVFHLLQSRIYKDQGDLDRAITEEETGLRLSRTRLAALVRQSETEHLAGLEAEFAQGVPGKQAAERLYRAGMYAACAGNLKSAALYFGGIPSGSQTGLSVTQTAIIDILLHLARPPSNERPNPGGIVFVPDDRDDAYLWLARQMLEWNTDLCWPGALVVFDRYSEATPASGQGALLAARVLLAQVSWESAREYFRLATARESQNGQYAFELGVFTWLAGNDPAGALPWLEEAFDLSPSAVHAVRLAQLYQVIGKSDTALYYADRSMEFSAEDEYVRVWAGWVYRDNGHKEEARQAFETALQMNPQNREARQGLEELNRR